MALVGRGIGRLRRSRLRLRLRGQKADAAAAVAELLKLRPGHTVQKLTEDGSGASDNPTFRKEFQHIVEGARKAGLPES
jgi:adenylate cyclase